jgi:phosphoribosylanthranilate isomerase
VDLIQLHGEETPEYCAELQRRAGRNIIKAFCADDIPDAERLGSYHTTSFFLFDLAKRDLENDEVTGALDAMWADVSRTRRKGFRVFVAGALAPENVRDAIANTHAFCVDVCRGVETAPGVKDADALERFVSEVRS